MKEKILATMAEKIEAYGLRKFTIDEIAKDLKISKKTVYKHFASKNIMIQEYFETVIQTDKENTLKALEMDCSLIDKLSAVVYAYHKYKIPVRILDETSTFFPNEWKKIEDLKRFKLTALENILNEGINKGIIRSDIHLSVISLILETTSEAFLNSKFLNKNDLTFKQSTNEVLSILLNGISK